MRFKYILFGVLFFTLLCSLENYAYENSVYIWQRDWNEFIRESISKIQADADSFIVLCGDFRYKNGKVSIKAVNVNWSYFKKNTEVTLVFRINTETKKLFKTEAVFKVAENIRDIFSNAIFYAEQHGIKIKGIQFDYDCPTAKLADYSKFLNICKKYFPHLEISITALPTWLDNIDFKKLIKYISYYVLQLHSFKKPKNIDEARNIFLKDDASLYVKKASGLRHPYYISLPTYGYEVVFSKEGKFLGLRAEAEPIYLGKNVQYKTVMANPKQILFFLKYIDRVKPNNFTGVFWFRLPVKTDEFNWYIATLKAVMKNRSPAVSLKTEIVSSKGGLYELYLINNGEQNLFTPVSVKISWPRNYLLFYDVLGKYEARFIPDDNGIIITGIPPKAGERKLVAWFKNKNGKKVFIKISEVVINEKNK